MRENKLEEVVEELSTKYCKKKTLIKVMFIETQKAGYDIKSIEDSIREFYNQF